LVSDDKYLNELGEAARRAGNIVTEHIDSMMAEAERRADQIQEDARREAELTKREALDSASRVFERIQTLERPLGELVETLRVEVDRVGRELESQAGRQNGPAIESTATDATPALETDSALDDDAAPALDDDAAPALDDDADAWTSPETDVKPDTQPPAAHSGVATSEPDSEPAPRPEAPSPTPDPEHEAEPERRPEPEWKAESTAVATPSDGGKAKRGRLSRLRGGGGRKGVFISSQGHCAVCQRTFMAGSQEALDLSGWCVNDDVGLCPECQSNGWQLPEDTTLPYWWPGA
jgi:vacuolar-type H+-ATPase subunit H